MQPHLPVPYLRKYYEEQGRPFNADKLNDQECRVRCVVKERIIRLISN